MSKPTAPKPSSMPVGVCTLGDAIEPWPATPPIQRVTWRLAEVSAALGISRRAPERERAAGRFPLPDLKIGKMPLWRVETIRAWIERGGRA